MPRLAAVLAFAAVAPAQQPAAPMDLEQLAQKVDAAHRVQKDSPPIESFTASLILVDLAADAAHRVDAELQVDFLLWQPPGRDRKLGLIRYQVLGSDKPLLQGRDQNGHWGVFDGRTNDLLSKEHEADREFCQRNVRLARQLLEYLDPGSVLRRLQQPSPVTGEALRLGRETALQCLAVEGGLPAFPLRRQAGDELPVRAKVYVDQHDGVLRAIAVTPLDARQQPVAADTELLLFSDHRPIGGRLVPMRVRYLEFDQQQRRRPQVEITLTTLKLDAGLRAENFDRPK